MAKGTLPRHHPSGVVIFGWFSDHPMSIKTIIYLISFCCLAVLHVRAQIPVSKTDSAVIGVWKGTSICQVKNSACHDENVVYYISKGQGADTFDIRAVKIVNGKEVEMGTINCKLDRKGNQLISDSYGLWTFTLKGDNMEGTLLYKGDLYRKIKVSKQP